MARSAGGHGGTLLESDGRPALDPTEILDALVALDPGLRLETYYSERAVFYNPGGAAPLGGILAAIKDHDGPNDSRSRLSRPGVYRLAFQLSPAEFVRRFDAVPPRPVKGQVVHVPADVSVLDRLTPHPVYAWMRWVQVLCPSRATFDELQPLIVESLTSVRARWATRARRR